MSHDDITEAFADEVRGLESLLEAHQCWCTADYILRVRSLPETESNRREVRRMVSESANIIQGNLGYRHIHHASADEVRHAQARLRSQARRMNQRADAIEAHFGKPTILCTPETA